MLLQERGLSEVCLRGMETEHEHEHPLVVSSSAPTTVTSVAPFHYLISEQAKSIAALQVRLIRYYHLKLQKRQRTATNVFGHL